MTRDRAPQPVVLKKTLARSIRQGHPWIYKDALTARDTLANGALVEVRTRDGRPLARGFWDARSPIAVRVLESMRASGGELRPGLSQGRQREGTGCPRGAHTGRSRLGSGLLSSAIVTWACLRLQSLRLGRLLGLANLRVQGGGPIQIGGSLLKVFRLPPCRHAQLGVAHHRLCQSLPIRSVSSSPLHVWLEEGFAGAQHSSPSPSQQLQGRPPGRAPFWEAAATPSPGLPVRGCRDPRVAPPLAGLPR